VKWTADGSVWLDGAVRGGHGSVRKYMYASYVGLVPHSFGRKWGRENKKKRAQDLKEKKSKKKNGN